LRFELKGLSAFLVGLAPLKGIVKSGRSSWNEPSDSCRARLGR